MKSLTDRKISIINKVGWSKYMKLKATAVGIIELCDDFIVLNGVHDPSGNAETYIDNNEILIIGIIETLIEA